MAVTAPPPPRARNRRPPRRRSYRGALIALAAIVLLAVGAGAAVYAFSGVTLAADAAALGRVHLQLFAGSLSSVQATTPDGRSVPLVVSDGTLTPRTRVAPGERISISVVVRRPGWASWALGKERRETLTVQTPVASIANRWVTAADGRATVRFDVPVDRVSVGGATVAGRTVALPARHAAGSVAVRAAARPWESFGQSERVTWFPAATGPVVLASPAPDARIDPLQPIRLTFSQPVSKVLGSDEPTLVPHVAGRWATVDTHTIVFHPSGAGAPFDSTVSVRFPASLLVAGATGAAAHSAKSLKLDVAPASFLRLQQLLAQEGYLPLVWNADGADVPQTMRAELASAVDPPQGRFLWRYPNTPTELKSMWSVGQPNEIVRGAV
ncbi:MAG TPA: hypothetical protein VHC01_08380, partial [Gaiellaceae bacterium]|nr:hypothetical protein [Gaiellaceae bacterium]